MDTTAEKRLEEYLTRVKKLERNQAETHALAKLMALKAFAAKAGQDDCGGIVYL